MPELNTPGVKIGYGHQRWGDQPDWHAWVYAGPIRADDNGDPAEGMTKPTWQKWCCVNPHCIAWGLIANTRIVDLLDAAMA